MVDRRRMEIDEDIARSGWLDWAVAGATFALGVRPMRSAILAGVAITVVIYVLFRIIGIELPTRILWF